MEYMIKCSFCGGTYFVNSGNRHAKFYCEACGATNSTDDILETITTGINVDEDGKDEDVHFEYYLSAAEGGDAKAQFKIGVYYD